MDRFEWQPGTEDGVALWWRVERTETGRLRSVGVRAVDDHDTSPEVPRDLREPRLCPACERDLAHTGAWHRRYAPYRPPSLPRLLGLRPSDPLAAPAPERATNER